MNARNWPQDASELTFRMNKVRVVVNGSTIEDAVANGDFNAVVSSDDASLAMAAGVSGSIRAAAGDSVQEEAARLLPVSLGDVVVTSAGRLKARYIFHAVTLDLRRGLRPSELTIMAIGRAIFRRSEDLGVKRIAIPSIATGAARFPARNSARLILESLAEHASHPSNLQDVVFCLPHEETRLALISELNAVIVKDFHAGHHWRNRREQPLIHEALLARPGQAPSSGQDAGAHPRPTPRQTLGAPLSAQATRTDADSDVPRSRWLTNIIRRLRSEAKRKERREEVAQGRLFNWTAATDARQSATQVVRHLKSRANRPMLHDRYVLLEEVGRGGMGIVYLAWDVVLRQTVAIKTLLPGSNISDKHIEKLRHEAALQMRLAHQGIVRLFHFEPMESAIGPYLIMEYVSWPTADRWIAEAGADGLPSRAVLRLGERLCEALASAHDADVLHLDIKPSNVFIDPAGEQPKLADFGIAKSLGPRRPDALVTRLVGTPGYMAPEQMTRGAKVGPWTDVYLLAGTLWKLITGHLATEERDEWTDPVTAAALAAVNRGLAQSVDERPATAAAFGALLAAASESARA